MPRFYTRTYSILTVAVCAAALFSVSAARGEEKSYEGHRLMRMQVQSMAEVEAVEAAGGVVLNCVPSPGNLEVVAPPDRVEALRALAVDVEVLHEDFAALLPSRRETEGVTDAFDDFFLDFHPYGDANSNGTIVWYMHELAGRYPDLATVFSIGNSIEGRPIWVMRISNDAVPGTKPAAFYHGCQHAREWIAATPANFMATWLLQNYETDPVARGVVDNMEIFLAPVVNPDGYSFSWTDDRLWRKNRRYNGDNSIGNPIYGVDLNRNWGFAWGYDDDGSSASPSSATFRGTGPFSEPETQALRDFYLAHPNIRTNNDIHSYSQLLLWPWGYVPELCPDDAEHLKVGTRMVELIEQVHGEEYTAGPTNTTIYATNGDSADWTYGQLGILSFSFEMRPADGAFGSGFLIGPEEIIPNNEELLPALLAQTNADFVRAAVKLEFAEGVPTTLTPGVDTVIPFAVLDNYESLASGTLRMFYRYDPAGPFIETTPMMVGSNAYEAVLPATNCTSQPEFYFEAQGDGGTYVRSPYSAPALPHQAPMAMLSENLSSDPGWTTEGAWAYGTPTGQGSYLGDPTAGHTGSSVYGYNLDGDYAMNLPATYLTTPPIDCSDRLGVHLEFYRWLGVESGFSFDQATVEVSTDGQAWTVVWRASDESGTTNIDDGRWVRQDLDISSLADDQPSVQLRWGMGPTDDSVAYCGWNIDDVSLYSTGCHALKGDYNGDMMLTLADYVAFPACMNGPGDAPGAGCGVFDFDVDGDVDLTDFSAFAVEANGGR